MNTQKALQPHQKENISKCKCAEDLGTGTLELSTPAQECTEVTGKNALGPPAKLAWEYTQEKGTLALGTLLMSHASTGT